MMVAPTTRIATMPTGGTPSLRAARVATPLVPQANAAIQMAPQTRAYIGPAYGTLTSLKPTTQFDNGQLLAAMKSRYQ